MTMRAVVLPFAFFHAVLAAQTPNYSGTWSIPTISYTCGWGAVNINVQQLQIVQTTPTVQVTGIDGGALTGTVNLTSLTVSRTRTLPIGCTESCWLTLSFPDPDRCTGTLTLSYTGNCLQCYGWQLPLTGSRAGYTTFGAGCAGSLGVSHLAASQPPRLGQTFVVVANNLPQAVAVMISGFSSTQAAFGPLPFPLALIGMPGCNARASLDVTDVITGTGTTASWQLTVPIQTNLLGVRFYQQALVYDPMVNPFNGVMSDAATVTVGL